MSGRMEGGGDVGRQWESLSGLIPRSWSLTGMRILEKVIFLDVDGVLHASTGRGGYLRQDCLSRLKRIVSETGAEIVLSTNWRKSKKMLGVLKRTFKQHGLKWVDVTPIAGDTMAKTRREEIGMWLKANEYQGEWIAIDDLDLSTGAEEPMKPHLIRTKSWEGMDANTEALAISALGKKRRSSGSSSTEYGEAKQSLPLYKAFNSCVTVS